MYKNHQKLSSYAIQNLITNVHFSCDFIVLFARTLLKDSEVSELIDIPDICLNLQANK